MDANKFQLALKDFAIAYYQKQGELAQVLPVNHTNVQIPISFPDLTLYIRNAYIKALDQSNEHITQEDRDLLDALNEVVETFPLWTREKLGDSIKAKLEGFLHVNDLDVSIEQKNTLYGNLGDIAFGSYLDSHNHKHPLLIKYSNMVIISNIIQKIDDMLKLIRYDKNDLKNILSATIYMKDNPALVLSSDYVDTNKLFEDFNNTNREKVYAGLNTEFKEIIWLYPSEASPEPDSYVIYNVEERTWVYGKLIENGAVATFTDRSVYSNTITTGRTSATSDYYIFDNEPDDVYTGDGQSLSSFIESASFDLDEGKQIMFIDKIIPDYSFGAGEVINLELKFKDYPNSTERVKGPFAISQNTKKIDMRVRGRQANVRVSATNDSFWRWGSVRMSAQPDGER